MTNIDYERLPRHVAIIMDGNGRWAKRNALNRLTGHKKGADAVRSTVRVAREIGIRYLTLYAFSVENWSRPKEEINALMKLLEDYLHAELQEMTENGIRLQAIGDIDSLPERVRSILLETIDRTASNTDMVLTLALSYGGRDEMVEVAKRLVHDCLAGKLEPQNITRDAIAQRLFTTGMPDPDLLIRTSGECRISNFLLWQLAYTELYFVDILWPEFSRESFMEAILDYQRRERRFGMTGDQLART